MAWHILRINPQHKVKPRSIYGKVGLGARGSLIDRCSHYLEDFGEQAIVEAGLRHTAGSPATANRNAAITAAAVMAESLVTPLNLDF